MKVLSLLLAVVTTVSAASLDSTLRPVFLNSRITNGKDAVKGEAPFIVSLKERSHFCGGSIIDKHWVLTAAHCLTYESFEVIAGLHQRNNKSDVQIRQISSWRSQLIHQNYKGDSDYGPYDIGLIYIAEPFNLNALARDGSAPVAKINLPSDLYQQTGWGKIYGWGRINSGAIPNTLKTLDIDIIDYTECKAALPSKAPLDPLHICAHNSGTSDGACEGDSGGPLVTYTAAGVELAGIASWGYPFCSRNKYASVYTRTSIHINWIQNTIDNFDVVDKAF